MQRCSTNRILKTIYLFLLFEKEICDATSDKRTNATSDVCENMAKKIISLKKSGENYRPVRITRQL